jgi:hypothetical protein
VGQWDFPFGDDFGRISCFETQAQDAFRRMHMGHMKIETSKSTHPKWERLPELVLVQLDLGCAVHFDAGQRLQMLARETLSRAVHAEILQELRHLWRYAHHAFETLAQN